MNCCGRDNRGYCEYRLPEHKTLDFLHRNSVTMQARSGELWWSTLADDSYSSTFVFVPKHVTLSEKTSLALLVSIPASWISISWHCMIRTSRAILVDFRTEIGRSHNSHFLFLGMARKPHTTQSHVSLSSWTFLKFLACLAALTSSELLSCAHGADMFTWYVEKCQLCSSQNSQLDPTECLESSRQDTDRGKL